MSAKKSRVSSSRRSRSGNGQRKSLKSKGRTVTSIGRVVKIEKWESSETCLQTDYKEHKIGVENRAQMELEQSWFDHVLHRTCGNQELFNVAVRPLCDNIIQGAVNALCFSYGQSQTGKTYKLLGSLANNREGLLSFAMEYLLAAPNTKSVSLSAMEIYGTSDAKIKLFDLFDTRNQSASWKRKHELSVPLKATVFTALKQRVIDASNVAHARNVLSECAMAPHYVKRVKSREFIHASSNTANRGHVAYFVRTVTLQQGQERVAYLVLLDLAGTDNLDSAATVSNPKRYKLRKGESKVLNYGLVQLQMVLGEVNGVCKGQISNFAQSGIRRILLPLFRDVDPQICIIFSLSPSTTNAESTRNTLRFARFTGAV